MMRGEDQDGQARIGRRGRSNTRRSENEERRRREQREQRRQLGEILNLLNQELEINENDLENLLDRRQRDRGMSQHQIRRLSTL